MSNGSERMPERCVHAPDGPDWAGLRELPTPKPAYEAMVEDARILSDREWQAWWPKRAQRVLASAADAVEALVAMEQRLTDHIVQLAAERDALVKDRDSWKRLWERLDSTSEKHYENLIQDRMDAEAERDALRTQLDSMTVEWHTTWSVSGRGLRRQKRLVSPWTVVEGDDQ